MNAFPVSWHVAHVVPATTACFISVTELPWNVVNVLAE
jgi:hypothetical protein